MLDIEYLKRVEQYFESGDCAFEFEHGEEERRLAIIEFLETLMDLGELADVLATKLIFKDAYATLTSEEGVGAALEQEGKDGSGVE
ncbi:MAG: hypothetical protein KUA35_00105 [Pseudodesulfovibrio sp.]|uniref:Uncharacterized protein n=1 Tax=Pseudodesulfovibrio aespoeensis (strain ATCC 700646 / DSM 10631 / Aspo-2) TaxID=643562 RepID=E6VVU2_PSEA9|nr:MULTISPECIES: hypothetical protein [Pseudodesulfovibrio]MBU4192947.1 hypothetical protein [Pseudomonadota bacterium]ADU61294.1 hypothetical protein Daes_0267 [Pseudodesulfovibrio aespoeensis Aspo-2]MBU4243924.1 hypothetical protein [Pseudomonadota bacterium]MBU4379339.1 hypothetical protein [Pseudomonadota bacterium]MBU4476755.1 hypothetical protein [Pseudomonadota bacterium]